MVCPKGIFFLSYFFLRFILRIKYSDNSNRGDNGNNVQ